MTQPKRDSSEPRSRRRRKSSLQREHQQAPETTLELQPAEHESSFLSPQVSSILDPAPSPVLHRASNSLGRAGGAGEGSLPGSAHLSPSGRDLSALPSSTRVQATLRASSPNDPLEREADRFAERLVNQNGPSTISTGGPANVVQKHSAENPTRGLAPEEEEQVQLKAVSRAGDSQVLHTHSAENPTRNLASEETEQVQLTPTPANGSAGQLVSRDVESGIEQLRGSGEGLPESARLPIEQGLGHDLSGVQVHTGAGAASLNRQLDAQAFTRGRDIFFAEGQYSPGTPQGDRLLAHELTHVVQQGAAPARPGTAPAFGKLQRTSNAVQRNDWLRGTPTQLKKPPPIPPRPKWKRSEVPQGGGQKGPQVGVHPAIKSVGIAPKKMVTDGVTTALAVAVTNPAGRPVDWTIESSPFTASISAGGIVKVDANLPKELETTTLNVTAQDREIPAVSKSAEIELWNADYRKAELEYADFISKTYKYDKFRTSNGFGRFDVIYDPAAKRVKLTVKVKFEFPEGAPTGGKKAYVQNIVNQMSQGFSQKFDFENVRYPSAIWKKLNPTKADVEVVQVKNNEHFLFKSFAKTNDTANVSGGGVVEFFKGDETANLNTMTAATKKGELQQFKKIAKTIEFEKDSADVPPEGITRLTNMANYLKRMNNPKFSISIQGRFKGSEAKGLADQRELAVKKGLESRGVTNHTLNTANTRGSGRKVEFDATLPVGFTNTQNTTLHEFGHMLGLDDEYAYKQRTLMQKLTGKYQKTDTYDLNKKAFGEDYAEQTGQLFESMDVGSASLMEGGSELRAQHYVTIWDAFVQTAAKADVPNTKFTHDDWKFNA